MRSASCGPFPILCNNSPARLPFIYADLLYCTRHEMVIHLDDLLRRRMPLLILTKLTEGTLRRIANFVAAAMGWDEAAINREVASCRQR
jgi:glycerol-3-phosphate dehydrogenase